MSSKKRVGFSCVGFFLADKQTMSVKKEKYNARKIRKVKSRKPKNPTSLTVTRGNKIDELLLKWSPPFNEDIIEYIVEKKDGTSWNEFRILSGNRVTCRIKKLREGERHQFRVKTVNRYGKSTGTKAVEFFVPPFGLMYRPYS
ncbi:twitchin-like [Leptopilina boulardi]|uniref:twitchin-like n=1 Tax=Leptopilina boulardi TaxID=63433 RepID=UPI0021F5FD11|nr:twitchin-like [Leptopilina boulardi]